MTSHDSLLVFGSGECDQFGISDLQDYTEDGTAIVSLPMSLPDVSFQISKVVCGGMHALILSTDGRLFAFGCNDDGALGRDMKSPPCLEQVEIPDQVSLISAGDSHSVAVTTSNKLYVWGQYRNVISGGMGRKKFEPEQVGQFELNGKVIRKIASGCNHTLVLAGSKIFSWGDPETGATGRKLTSRRKNTQSMKIESMGARYPVDVWAGSYFSFYKDANDRQYAFGLNNYGQLGLGHEFDRYEPTLMKNCPIFETIQGGEHHTIGVTVDGDVYAWGRNDDCQLGINLQDDERNISTPTKVNFTEKIQSISVGGHYSYAISKTNQLYSWGSGEQFVLGTQQEDSLKKPTRIAKSFLPNGFKVKSLGCGAQHVVIGCISSEDTDAINMGILKLEINKIAKKTVMQNKQANAEEEEAPPVRRVPPEERVVVDSFFVNKDLEQKAKQSSYRGVSGLTDQELKEQFKEGEAPKKAAAPTGGFFINKEREASASKTSYRGVSGMTAQQINEEYKEDHQKKKSTQSRTLFGPASQYNKTGLYTQKQLQFIKEYMATPQDGDDEIMAEIRRGGPNPFMPGSKSTLYSKSKDKKSSGFPKSKDKKSSVFSQSKDNKGSVFPKSKDNKSSVFSQSKDNKSSVFSQIKDNKSSVFSQSKDNTSSVFPKSNENKGSIFSQSKDDKSSVFSQTKDNKGSVFSQSKDNEGAKFFKPKDKIE